MIRTVCVLLLINVVFCNVEVKWRESEDGSKFFIEKAQMYTWGQAWYECARKNMSLIAIDTYNKHVQIGNLLRRYYDPIPYLWIGGNNFGNRLQYTWASTSEIFTFTNWRINEPDKLRDSCVLMIDDLQWHNYFCSFYYGYICEENQAAKNIYGGGGQKARAQNFFFLLFILFAIYLTF